MRILAIDTSHAAGSVVACDAAGEAALPLGDTGQHASQLAATLRDAAARRGWPLASVELVAVVRGPGSFTGLRVGVATAKALAWAANARLVAVSGFELVAWRAAADGPIAVAFDAGRGELFASRVTPRGDRPGRWQVAPPALVPAAAWLESLPQGSSASGPGLDANPGLLAGRSDLVLPPAGLRQPHASAAAHLARLAIETDPPDDPFTLVPLYARPSYADERRAGG